jgi:hypothetical protein
MTTAARCASFARASTRLVDCGGRRRTAVAGVRRGHRASAAAAESEPSSAAPVSAELARARRALLWRAADAATSDRPLDVYTEALVAAVREGVARSPDSEGSHPGERASSDGFSGAEMSAALDHLAFDEIQSIVESFEVSRGVEVMGTMRQVVVVSPGFDSRAFRVPWPRGTCVFELGNGEAHRIAARALRAAGAKPPRGCSHRRVDMDPTVETLSVGEFEARMMRVGYKPEIPSVWILQDIASVDAEVWRRVLEEATAAMCAGSAVVGHVPEWERGSDRPENVFGETVLRDLAVNGVLGRCFPMTALGFPARHSRSSPLGSGVFAGKKRKPSARQEEYFREQTYLVEHEHGDEEGFEA